MEIVHNLWTNCRLPIATSLTIASSGYHGATIGLLICKEKNDVVARWALEQTGQPIGITTYELSQLLPAQEAIEQMLEQ